MSELGTLSRFLQITFAGVSLESSARISERKLSTPTHLTEGGGIEVLLLQGPWEEYTVCGPYSPSSGAHLVSIR